MKKETMGKFGLAIILLLMVIVAVCCTYKNAEDVYPVSNAGCDTTNISYSGYIAPFLSANCYSCHSQANSGLGDGFVLDTWLNVKAQAENGNLVGDISNTYLSSANHMPQGLPSLTYCDILKIKAWVTQGSKNN